jgi:choline dehydrogenase-like flavoprotein
MYMPWWLDNRNLDFPRGYHIQFYGGRQMPQSGAMPGIHRWNGGGYGKNLKDDYRKYYGSVIAFQGLGEMIPNKDSYCEVDSAVVDKWGIPVLRFHFKWSDHELKQIRHVQETCRDLIEKMGGTPLDPMPGKEQGYGITVGGEMIHEVGTTRMGESPKTSVLDAWCRAHDVPNLFVADGGPFVSNADKNPTWTILALAWRTAEHIAEERKKGNL